MAVAKATESEVSGRLTDGPSDRKGRQEFVPATQSTFEQDRGLDGLREGVDPHHDGDGLAVLLRADRHVLNRYDVRCDLRENNAACGRVELHTGATKMRTILGNVNEDLPSFIWLETRWGSNEEPRKWFSSVRMSVFSSSAGVFASCWSR